VEAAGDFGMVSVQLPSMDPEQPVNRVVSAATLRET